MRYNIMLLVMLRIRILRIDWFTINFVLCCDTSISAKALSVKDSLHGHLHKPMCASHNTVSMLKKMTQEASQKCLDL